MPLVYNGFPLLSSWAIGQTVFASQLNAQLKLFISQLATGNLWPGAIVPFGLPVAQIPAGWGLCDGGVHSGVTTVDLRDRFIRGANQALSNVGTTGGASLAGQTLAAHNMHNIGTNTHSNHFVQDIGGTHPPQPGTWNAAPDGAIFLSGPTAHSGMALNAHPAHTGQNLDSGGNGPHAHATVDTTPPYHARPHIQFLAAVGSFTSPIIWTTGHVPTAAELNQDLRDNPNFFFNNGLPYGAIIGWFATSGQALPPGWHVCDGTLGTPPLLQKYLISSGVTYAVDADGGSNGITIPNHSNHSAQQANNHGTHTPTQAASHSHPDKVSSGATPGSAPTLDWAHTGFAAPGSHSHANFAVDPHSQHLDPNTGFPTINNLPPYQAVQFIMLVTPGTWTTPRTWTTGDTVQASEFNTFLRDNFSYLQTGFNPSYGLLYAITLSGAPNTLVAAGGTTTFPNAPDIRGLFLIGESSAFGQGGAISVTPAPHASHVATSPDTHDGHVLTQTSDHSVVNGDVAFDHSAFPTTFTASSPPGGHFFLLPTQNSEHVHNFTVDGHSAHGALSLLPPFMYLYICTRQDLSL